MQQPAFQPPPPPSPPPGSFGAKITGAARGLAFVRALSGQAFGLAVFVFVFQAIMPEGRRPSDLLGGFHGSTESAEMNAKRVAQVQTTRENTNAQAVAPYMAQSYETQAQIAGIGDGACLFGGLIGSVARDNPNAMKFAQVLQSACGQGDKIRSNITRSITQTAR